MSKKNLYLTFTFLLINCLNSFGQFTLDSTYGNSGIANTGVDGLTSLFLNDNKVMIPYSIVMSYPISTPVFGIRRLNTDGSLDTSFGTNGIATYTSTRLTGYKDRFDIYNQIKQPDGKIIITGQTYQVGGFAYYYNFFLFRFNADGTTDTSFGTNGLVIYSLNSISQFRERFLDVALDSNDRIIAVGYTTANIDEKDDAVVFRFLPNGVLDTSFANNGILKLSLDDSDYFNHLYVLNDDSILLTGATVQTPNQNMLIAKIDNAGNFDNSFGTNGMTTIDFGPGPFSPTKLFFKPNNKTMLVGTSINDTGSVAAFAQLNSDGSLDTTFSTDGKNLTYIPVPNHYAIGAPYIALLPNNKYLVTSSARQNNSYNVAVARINEDTTLDTSFQSNGVYVDVLTGTNEFVRGVYIQNDSKALIFVNGTIRRYIIDGQLSISETENIQRKITIVPNPFIDKIEIQSNINIQKVEVYNIEGKKLKTVDSIFNEIDLTNLEKGVYFIKIYSDNQIFNQKIIRG